MIFNKINILNRVYIFGKSQKSYLISFLLFISISIGIMLNSYLDPDGCLSPDSTNYLALAQNLIDHNSLYLNYAGGSDKFFAIWPIGYPVLIFLVSKITSFSVFWASKFLNILLIGGMIIIFNKIFKKDGYIFSSIFIFTPFFKVFSMTWSETGFIFGLLWFVISLSQYIKTEKKILYSLNILLAILFLFLNRYIGIFSIGIVGLIIFYLVYIKEYRNALLLLVPILLSSLLVSMYLYHNYIETGYSTGMPRIPSPENYLELFIMTATSLVREVNLLYITITPISKIKSWAVFTITFVFQFIIFYYFYKRKLFVFLRTNKAYSVDSMLFLISGIMYYFFIICMRWKIQFDALNNRLLSPGTFLIIIGLLLLIKSKMDNYSFHNFKKAFLIIVLAAYILDVITPFVKNYLDPKYRSYNDNVLVLSKLVDNIPYGSILVFGDVNYNYLRLDLQIPRPRYTPYYEKQEDWNSFIKELHINNQNKRIYVYIEKMDEKRKKEMQQMFHPSVYEFLIHNQDKQVVEINDFSSL